MLDTETVSSFNKGIYLDLRSGRPGDHVHARGGVNAVVSGIFLDPTATRPRSSAHDDAGELDREYAAQGYDVIGDTPRLPSYATVTPSGQSYHLVEHHDRPPALQNPGGSGRIAAAWYATTSFSVNVDLTDGRSHDLELYFLDWDSPSRVEQVQISDAATGACWTPRPSLRSTRGPT